MTRLADLATQVLDEANRDGLGKTAATAYASPQSAQGVLLREVATNLRSHRPAEPTYQDLQEFRTRHGI